MDPHHDARTFDDILQARAARRRFLQGAAALAALAALPAGCGETEVRAAAPRRSWREGKSSLRFQPLLHGADERMHVSAGHAASVVIAWGDALLPGAPAFDPAKLDGESQRLQFGTDCDFIAYMPLPRGSDSSDHGLLCVNHENSRLHMMSTEYKDHRETLMHSTKKHVECEMAAQGHSVVEVRLVDGRWGVVQGSAYARRLNALDTRFRVSGPAAGHERLRTKDDPEGLTVLGTFNNCAGGTTPWGTVLVCEENINQVFLGGARGTREQRNHSRMGVGEEVEYSWSRHVPRFSLANELNEPNRHGWVVEYDPYDPASTPKKRTSLGRFKHEGATCAVDPDGRVVVYMGDDDEDEFVYKWTSARPFDAADPAKNADLLDDGVLHAARFDADGSVTWLPLVHGSGPLTAENGFASQADVLIEARSAATLLGATKMDRPEDVETNPANGRVYVMLTNNVQRTKVDAANPRAKNRYGHVLELDPPRDAQGRAIHAASKHGWTVFLLGGDPADKEQPGRYHPDIGQDGWLSCPDNCTFDPLGRLWIATDGGYKKGMCDGVWACDVDGEGRALTRRFFRSPLGSEVCGPCFTPDGTTLFVSVQHPGEYDADGDYKGINAATPTSRFPDYDLRLPPRSAVVALRRDDGGALGG